MRILQILSEKPLGFSELKREVGIESSGLLAFHLGKLTGLVKLNPEGSYALTDEGKEALRIVEASRKQPEGHLGQRPALHLPHQKAILAGLLVTLIVVGSLAIYQQEQISGLNRQVGTTTIDIGGVRYYYESFPNLLPQENGTSINFHGVTFTSVSPSFIMNGYSDPTHYIYGGSVRLSNGTLLNLTGKTVGIEVNFAANVISSVNGKVNYTTFLESGVAVSFPGGDREVWNGYTVTAANSPGSLNIPHSFVQLNVTYTPPVSNPWFTGHTGPQAGVLWNYTSDESTFYVSVSSRGRSPHASSPIQFEHNY